MANAIKFTEIFGKEISSYDGWNGDHKTITIDGISFCKESNEIIFTGKGYRGNEQKVYVPILIVDELMEKGKASATYEIDHCVIRKEWEFIN